MAHLENQYGEWVVELEPDGYGYHEFPDGFRLDNLAIGDTYTVETDEGDDEEA